MASATRALRDRAASSGVEFAILAPLLIVVVFGIMEFSRAIWTDEALANVAAKTARCVGLSLSSCAPGGAYSATNTAQYAGQVAAGWGITLPTGDVSISTASSCPGQTGQSSYVTVALSYSFTTIVPKLLPQIGSRTLSGTSCFPQG